MKKIRITNESTLEMIPNGDPPPNSKEKFLVKKPKSNRLSVYTRLLSYTCKHVGLVILGNIMVIISSLAQLAIPYICGEIVNAITDSS